MLVPRRFLQLIVVTIACLAIATTTTTLCAQELSQEGQNQKAIHDYLFEKFLEGRETKYQGKGDARALKELTILKETREIRDGDELLLSPRRRQRGKIESDNRSNSASHQSKRQEYGMI